jgi:hypothetical protein
MNAGDKRLDMNGIYCKSGDPPDCFGYSGKAQVTLVGGVEKDIRPWVTAVGEAAGLDAVYASGSVLYQLRVNTKPSKPQRDFVGVQIHHEVEMMASGSARGNGRIIGYEKGQYSQPFFNVHGAVNAWNPKFTSQKREIKTLAPDTIYFVRIEATVSFSGGGLLMSGAAYVKVDPLIEMAPIYPFKDDYEIEFSPGLFPVTHHIAGENNIGVETLTGTQGNEVFTPLPGAKYVRVVQNVDDTFQVAELQVFETGTGINVARQFYGGIADAKDVGHGGVKERANDGNTNMVWSGSSMWHSGSEAGTWLEIELANPTDLDSVHFWGRSDEGLQSRQGDFNLIIEDESRNELYNERIVGLGSTTPYHGSIPVDTLASADLVATLEGVDTWVFELGSNDQLTIDNPDPGVFTTVLDINDATVEVRLLGELMPGEVYELFDVDSIIGTYDELILPAGVDGSMLLVDGTVTALPEPATLSLLALGGLVALRRRRRKQ